MSVTVNGRTFDTILGRADPRNARYPVSALLAAKPKASAYDKIQDSAITALTKRVAALEHAQPVPPAPIPPPSPVPPTPVPPIPPPPTPAGAHWIVHGILDQQATGMCVGYGCTDYAISDPHPVTGLNLGAGGDDETGVPDALYDAAQTADGTPPDPQSGATVNGGMAALKGAGYISAYHWAVTNGVGVIADVIAAIRQLGPVVLGIPWTNDMFNPDPSGLIHATGSVAGGHCLVANGVNADGSLVTLHNSWGAGWAIGGEATILTNDLAGLLAQQGDAAVPIKA